MQRVFISYSRRNKGFAERLARDLSDAGLEVWIDFRQIHAGEKWREEIFKGLERSEIVIALMSPAAIASEWVRLELHTAREQNKFIIPVMINDVLSELNSSAELNWLLDVQFINFEDRYEEAFPELLQALPGRRRVGPFNPVMDAAKIANPFKGLEAFQQTDAAFFFGREALVDKSLNRLRQDRKTRFLAVVGASGSGKSSLVRAGVIPSLRQGALPGSENWRMGIFTPGEQPVDALARRLAPLIEERDAETVFGMLQDTPEYFEPLVEEALADAPANARLLLVVDQFEEVFTRAGEADREVFLNIINKAVTHPDGRAHVLITMRADFFDRLSQYPDLAELFEQENMVIVTEMSPAELFRAIEGPAQAVGLVYDTGLPQRILDDVQTQPGSLPLLQYALKELYERREGSRLTTNAYNEIGGVRRALAQRAETVYNEMGLARQAIMRRLLLRLIEVNENGEATRRRVNREDLKFRDVPDEAVSELIDALTAADSRLLIASREIRPSSDQATPTTWIEISHEALIREWDRFQGWVAENIEQLRYGSEILKSAQDWRQRERDKSYLLTGNRLARAEEWIQDADATPLQREFVQASIEENERREVARQQQVERELALQSRAASRLRIIAVVLVIGLAVAAGLTVFALTQLDRANRAQAAAERSEQQALLNEQEARSLALSSSANRAFSDEEGELAVLLAVESNLIENAPPQSSRTLSEVSYAPGTRFIFPGHASEVRDTIYAPDGDTALSVADNELILWDASGGRSTGTEIRRFGKGGHTTVTTMAFRPGTNGTQVITGGMDDLLILWDATTGAEIRRFTGHTEAISDVAFSPDGRSIVSGGGNDEIILWDIDSGAIIQRLNSGVESTTTVTALTFSADGARIVVGDDLGVLRVWDVATRTWSNFAVAPDDADGFAVGITDMDANPLDASRVLVGFSDGTARIYDLNNIQAGPRATFTDPDTASLRAVAYSPDAERVAAGKANGAVVVWDVATRARLINLEGHENAVNSVDFDGDGQLIISGSQDESVRLWDVGDGSLVRTYEGYNGSFPVIGVYGADDELIISASNGSDSNFSLRVWDPATQLTIQELSGHMAPVNALAVNSTGAQVLSASDDATVILWDIASGQPLQTLGIEGMSAEGRDGFESIAFITDGRAIAGTSDGRVVIWELTTGTAEHVFPAASLKTDPGHQGDVYTVDVSPDGTRAITGARDNTLILWDIVNFTLLGTLEGHTDSVNAAHFNVDGTRVISGSSDDTLRLWDADPASGTFGGVLRQFEGHDASVRDVDFSPDWQSVVSTSSDGTVRLWEVSTGFELRRFSTNDGITSIAPRSVDFSRDGATVLTGLENATLAEWRVLTNREDLLAWTFANRFIIEPTCRERQLFDIQPLCDAQGVPVATATPFPIGTATPLVARPVLTVGGEAIVNTNAGDDLRVRSDTVIADDNIVFTLADGTRVRLTQGPVEANGFSWWYVETDDGQAGWAVSAVPQDGLQTLVAQ